MTANDGTADPPSQERSEGRDPPDIEANITSRSTWLRLLFMIVLGAIYALSRIIVFAVVVLQFFWVLVTSEPNRKLTGFGHSLALYTAELIDYLCYVNDERPFPFDNEWPV